MTLIWIVALLAAGGLLTYYSWWMLLHASDERVNRRGRFFRWPGTPEEDEAAGRETETAMLGVVLLVIGSVLLLAGVGMIIQYVQAG
jgi:hypothetical protein